MIIVINSQGKVVSQQNDNIFQGSVNANVIDLIAPFAENVNFYATFELPDGRLLPEKLPYGYLMTNSVKVVDGLNVWKLLVNFPITQLHGIVTIQLKGVIGNQIVCTSSVKVNVQKGVPYINEDEDLEPSQYSQLLQMITDVKGILGNKVEIASGQYEITEVNEDTVGTYYVYQEETDSYLLVNLPEDYNENSEYYELKSIGRVVNNKGTVYIEYEEGGFKNTLNFTKDGITINKEKIVTNKILEDSLIAEKIKYKDDFTKLDASNVQKAIEKMKTELEKVENSQVISLGTYSLSSSNWVLEDGLYKYKFKHKLFTDALVQGLIVTPDSQAIEDLNSNDILIYPEIDIEQESDKIAVAIIKADKKPNFNINADIKIQGTTVDVDTNGIKANQIVFSETDKIPVDNVQEAIEKVQENLETFETKYDEEKTKFAKLDTNGKVPASQLPSYVDDVIECYLHNGAMYLTRNGTGTDNDPYIYTDAVVPVSGKIYINIETNKQYRWSGSQYTIISESLALGETSSTAYSGAKGKQNSDNIATLTTTTSELVETLKTINNKKILVYNNVTNDKVDVVNIDAQYKGKVFEVEYSKYTYTESGASYSIEDTVRKRIFFHSKGLTVGVTSYEGLVDIDTESSLNDLYIKLNKPVFGITVNENNSITIQTDTGVSYIVTIKSDGTSSCEFNYTSGLGYYITKIWALDEEE